MSGQFNPHTCGATLWHGLTQLPWTLYENRYSRARRGRSAQLLTPVPTHSPHWALIGISTACTGSEWTSDQPPARVVIAIIICLRDISSPDIQLLFSFVSTAFCATVGKIVGTCTPHMPLGCWDNSLKIVVSTLPERWRHPAHILVGRALTICWGKTVLSVHVRMAATELMQSVW